MVDFQSTDTYNTLSNRILSDITVFSKYARHIPALNRRENWDEIVDRNMQMHIRKFPSLENEIRENFRLVFDKKVLPSLRALQFGGKPIEINPVRQYNCSYAAMNDWRAFSEATFLLLAGVGFGYSIQKHHVSQLPEIRKPKKTRRYLIGDSIEGWADSVKVLMKSYFGFNGSSPIYDFSDIREKGAPLVTSGGKAPGPAPLKVCLAQIESILSQKDDGAHLSTLEVHDILCHIADCILAGGIRRAAMLSLFSADDEDMLTCKVGRWYELNPQRARANNSVVVLRHRITKNVFDSIWERIQKSGSGEPGIAFSNNSEYGLNPCCEISLKDQGLCNLSEINAANVSSQADLNKRARAASFIGTLQATYTNFHYLREGWQKRAEKEALVGVSMTGIASGKVTDLDLIEAANAAVNENERVADLVGINKARRVTSVKPAGSTSLVLGTSSGIHGWFAPYYIRRIRIGKNEALYSYLKTNHPALVDDEYFRPKEQAVIEIPQCAPTTAIFRSEGAISLLERVKMFYSNWICPGHRVGDNTHSVSCTISINDDEWHDIGEWMWENRHSYNCLSVIPYDGGSYVQTPFQEISKKEYDRRSSHLHSLNLTEVIELEDETNLQGELACAGGACLV